ncbi:MAG: hypothetical protein KAT90_12350 [Gammaproteobacteria bacterium]|nr:hypothetical protein [Gammaproteobacteria bacterium]
MKRLGILFLFTLLMPIFSGCKANYIEISSDPRFSHYIGQRYVVNHDMKIRGINLPPGYGDTVDIYMISKLYKVEHKAPEVITQDIFPKGATFTINKIYECTNCLFDKPRHVSVTTDDFIKIVEVPIRVPMDELISGENVAKVN